jgi:hypothetical protein
MLLGSINSDEMRTPIDCLENHVHISGSESKIVHYTIPRIVVDPERDTPRSTSGSAAA